MRYAHLVLPSGSLIRLLFLASTVAMVIVVVGAHWSGNERTWFELPAVILGVRLVEMLVPILLVASCLSLLFVVVCVWRVSPRPITVILFFATAAFGVGILFCAPHVSAVYRREQPVVGLMLLFSIAAAVEVRIWRLKEQHFVTAMATFLIGVTFWFTISHDDGQRIIPNWTEIRQAR